MIAAATSARAVADARPAQAPAPADASFGGVLAKAQDGRDSDSQATAQGSDDETATGPGGDAVNPDSAAGQTMPVPAAPDALASAQAMLATIAGTVMPPSAAGGGAVSGRTSPSGDAQTMPDLQAAALPQGTTPTKAASPAQAQAQLVQVGGGPVLPTLGDKATGKAFQAADKAAAALDRATDGTDATAASAVLPSPGDLQQTVATFSAPADQISASGVGQAPAALPMAEVSVAHHLDLAKDGAWLDRLAHDIAQSADTSGQLRFSLAPEKLGRLDVALAQGADGTAIRLTTETREAHRIVAEAQPRLVAEARAQGLRVSETSVDLNNSGGAGSQPQAFGNQNARGEGHQPRHAARWPAPDAPAPVSTVRAAAHGGDALYA